MITNAALSFIRSGGYGFMIPLLSLSILSLAVVIERAFVLGRRVQLSPQALGGLQAAADRGDREAMDAALEGDKSLLGLIVRKAVALTQEQENTPAMQQAIEHCANEYVSRLTERLWILRAVGHIAPLLGLMGTVVGLAMAFSNIAEVGLSQQSVARGISIALTTTITGLGIALPTLFADYCLRAWADSRFRSVETLLRDVAMRFDCGRSTES